jgi:sporulenol synthase
LNDIGIVDKVHYALDKSCQFIKSNQSERGYWQDFNINGMGLSSQWVSGYIAYHLLDIPCAKNNVDKAINWLFCTEYSSGGWGFHQHNLPDADSTANVLRLLAIESGKENQIKSLHKYGELLSQYQDPVSGGFITYPKVNRNECINQDSAWCKPDTSVTAMAGLALMAVDYNYFRLPILKARDFLLRRQRSEGYWESYWWDCRIYATNIACEFLKNLGEKMPLEKATRWLIDISGNFSTLWGNGYENDPHPFYTSLSLKTLLSCGDRYREEIQEGITWLTENQNEDGSWNSKPILRVPNPMIDEPWSTDYRKVCEVVPDQNRLFTTATIMSGLCSYLNPESASCSCQLAAFKRRTVVADRTL